MEKVTFTSEGLQLAGTLWETDGCESRAVVFCHGAFEYQENWYEYAERLNNEGFTTFTFDFAGHGASDGLRSLVKLPIWAYNIRDAFNYLHGRGYQQFALVGWGSGGSASLLAAAHDRRIACAVLMSTPVLLVPTIPDRIAYGLASTFAIIKQRIVKKPLTLSRLNELEELRFLTDEEENKNLFSNPRMREIYQAIPMPDSLDSVWIDITQAGKKVKTPVLVIHGREDQMISADQASKLYNLLQGRKDLKLIDNCGHAVHLDHKKDDVYKLTAKWIKRYLNK